jgi:hypothetical protein
LLAIAVEARKTTLIFGVRAHDLEVRHRYGNDDVLLAFFASL